MTKRNNKIEKRLRKQISLYFYNSNHPELYTTDEIIRYEIEVDKIIGIFNQFIPILLQEQREELIKECLKNAKDDMTRLYDYDRIAENVINLMKK